MSSHVFRIVLLTVSVASPVLAGDLEPPGAPASTLIPGLQVATPITAVPVTIEQSGVYYLTGSFSVTSEAAHGIVVDADDVVIDLAGFSIVGPGTGTGRGVSAEGAVRTTLRNGTVRNFGEAGVFLGARGAVEDLRIEDCPLGLALFPGGRARRVHIAGCELGGVEAFATTELIDCSVSNSGGGIGVFAGSSVIRCSVLGSRGVGIGALGPVIVRDCSVLGAVGPAFSGASGVVFENCAASLCATGFEGEGGVTLRGCTARVCSVEGIAVAGSEGGSLIADCYVEVAPVGIRAAQPATIRGCTARVCSDEGIAVSGAGGSSLIADCQVDTANVGIRVGLPATVLRNHINNTSTEGIQIDAGTTDVTVLDNVVMNAASAIHHLGVGNNCFYARNTYTGGVNLGANATWGPFVFGSGNLNDDAGSDNPWSNIQH